jgi:hypothetical protein
MSFHSQTIEIQNVPADKMRTLVERAQESGTTPEEFALRLIVEGLPAPGKTFDERLAPFRSEVKESGITDGELDELFTEARRDYAREQKEDG